MFLSLGLILAMVYTLIHRALQSPPEFYFELLHRPPPASPTPGRKLTDHLLDGMAAAPAEKAWSLRFTQEEINAWLQEELPSKHPELLGSDFADPRVVLQGDLLRVAVTNIQRKQVYSADLKLYPRGDHSMACEFLQARVGRLPVPVNTLKAALLQAAAELGVNATWTRLDGGHGLLFEAPRGVELPGGKFDLVWVKVVDGELELAGNTVKSPLLPSPPNPEGPLQGPETSAQESR